MMQIEGKKCSGCGECLDACPVEAISMLGGKAAIDVTICSSCGACMQVCPEDAIFETMLAVPIRTAALQTAGVQPSVPVSIFRSESRLAWAGPVLSYVGKEIVPRLADTLLVALDRRLTNTFETRADSVQIKASQTCRRQRHQRRRLRGRML